MLQLALALAACSLSSSDLENFQGISSLVPGARVVAFGDLNGDGFPDLVTASLPFQQLSLIHI